MYTLCDLVAKFVDKPPGSVRAVILHLRRATERDALVQALSTAIGGAEIVDAIDGGPLVAGGHPTECGMDPGVIRTVGEVGCMASHIAVYRQALLDGISHLIVFEDDCVPVEGCLGKVQEYLRRVKEFETTFDRKRIDEFLLFGTCGCYRSRSVGPGLKATDHFNGSHAYMIGRPMMFAMIHSYLQFLVQGKTVPADGILPLLLQAEGLHAVCPEVDTALFAQNRAIPSYIVSEGTELRKD